MIDELMMIIIVEAFIETKEEKKKKSFVESFTEKRGCEFSKPQKPLVFFS